MDPIPSVPRGTGVTLSQVMGREHLSPQNIPHVRKESIVHREVSLPSQLSVCGIGRKNVSEIGDANGLTILKIYPVE